MKIYSTENGGQNRSNEGQILIEFIYLAFIVVLILLALGKARFDFVTKFKAAVVELDEKRNDAIEGIRQREPSGCNHRGNIKLSDSFISLFPNKTV